MKPAEKTPKRLNKKGESCRERPLVNFVVALFCLTVIAQTIRTIDGDTFVARMEIWPTRRASRPSVSLQGSGVGSGVASLPLTFTRLART